MTYRQQTETICCHETSAGTHNIAFHVIIWRLVTCCDVLDLIWLLNGKEVSAVDERIAKIGASFRRRRKRLRERAVRPDFRAVIEGVSKVGSEAIFERANDSNCLALSRKLFCALQEASTGSTLRD